MSDEKQYISCIKLVLDNISIGDDLNVTLENLTTEVIIDEDITDNI